MVFTKSQTDADRFWSHVDRDSGDCWLWTAALLQGGGYGRFSLGSRSDGTRRMVYAHRFAYELEHGSVPEDLEIDHLCRTRRCVRVDHLEAVSHRMNVLRGDGVAAMNALKSTCKRGHPFDESNTYTWAGASGSSRACKVCRTSHKSSLAVARAS